MAQNEELVENIKLAFELQKKGKYSEAIAALYKLLAVESDNLEAIIQIAYLFYLRHDIEISIEYYEKALAIEPDNIQALQGLFDIYKSGKKYEKVLELAKQIYNDEKNINNFAQLLFVLTLCSKYEEIVELYNNSEYTQDENKFIYFYLGIAYFKLNDYEKAKEFLLKVTEIASRNSDVIF